MPDFNFDEVEQGLALTAQNIVGITTAVKDLANEFPPFAADLLRKMDVVISELQRANGFLESIDNKLP